MVPFFRRAAALGAFSALFLSFFSSAEAVSTSAGAAILMEADSGRVLYSQNIHDPRPIASITKLMTALVAAERSPDLDAAVTVDPRAVGVEGSSLYLTAGEQLSLRDLLYGLMLHSGNDAAAAVAIHCAGEVETFVGWMNQRAAQLGMAHTHFMNPSGLDEEGHCSTAYDMALLAREVLKNPDLAQIVGTKTIRRGQRSLTNHNKLLWRYQGCVGLKTGYTQTAGRTLVSAAAREGATLICVTLHDPNDWADHASLLDYGFAHYKSYLLARPGKALARLPVAGSLARPLPVVTASPVRACLTAEEQPTARILLPQRLEAPVEQGQSVGRLVFYLDGQVVGQTDLIAAQSAPCDRPGGLRGLLGAVFRPLLPLPEEDAPLWQGILSANLTVEV